VLLIVVVFYDEIKIYAYIKRGVQLYSVAVAVLGLGRVGHGLHTWSTGYPLKIEAYQ